MQSVAEHQRVLFVTNPRLYRNPVIYFDEKVLTDIGYTLENILYQDLSFLLCTETAESKEILLQRIAKIKKAMLVNFCACKKDGRYYKLPVEIYPVIKEVEVCFLVAKYITDEDDTVSTVEIPPKRLCSTSSQP